MRNSLLTALVLVTTAPLAVRGVEGGGDDDFPVGQVVERVAAVEDPSQTYALYLPSAYTAERQWPLLILMDPRGRALLTMDLFRDAAERFGYVVVSSYDTRSDGPREPNLKALRAILPDTEKRLSLNHRRRYLVGFSGTARLAWDVATLLPGRVAGIIGAGGGFPSGYQTKKGLPFVFFGTAGTLDFNHDEMRALDTTLDTLGMPHRFEYFEGPHSWPPEELCTRAVGWLEIQAMRAGLRATDTELATDLFAAETTRARELEDAGEPLEAYFLYGDLTTDFDGLHDTAAIKVRAEELAKDPVVREGQQRYKVIAEAHERYIARFQAYMQELNRANPPPSLIRALRTLDIKDLSKRAADETDRPRAQAARRELENVFVFTSFYMPREFMNNAAPKRALAALQLADAIKPDNPRVCLAQARAHARLKHVRKALVALDCAAASGRLTASVVENDTDLATLAGENGYDEMLARLPR